MICGRPNDRPFTGFIVNVHPGVSLGYFVACMASISVAGILSGVVCAACDFRDFVESNAHPTNDPDRFISC